MTSRNQKLVDMLRLISEPTAADLEAVETMSEAELDAELAAAGVDFAAFEARLRRTLAQTQTQGRAVPLAQGVAWVRRGTRRWLQLTLDGLENLHRACVPQLLGAEAGDLRTVLPEAGLPVAVLSLHVLPAGGGVKLAVRWLAAAPQAEPVVAVRLHGQPLAAGAHWQDWGEAAQRTQGLRVSGVALTAGALAAHKGPVLAYDWEADAGRLLLDLLPVAEEQEDDGDGP